MVPKLYFKEYKELDGSVNKRVWKVADGPIIVRFEKHIFQEKIQM